MGKQTYSEKRKRERTIQILKMVAVGALVIGLGGAPSPRAMGKLLRGLLLGDTRENRRYANRKIRQLKNSGLLERQGVAFAVSDKGERVLDRERIWNLKIPTTSHWDKKWRLILFDIPQTKSDARKALNQILLGMDLVQYQQSVLIYPYALKETVLHVCRFYKITRYVSFITADDVDGSDKLKKHFKLS